MKKPDLLYHGSQLEVNRLRPHQAYDGLADIGTADGIFATPLRELALVFALGAQPDAQGRITRFVRSVNPLRVIFLEGQPNWGGVGYLYTVSSETFAALDEYQWLSTVDVSPLSCEKIMVDNCRWLVEEISEMEKREMLTQFKRQ